MGKLDKIAIIGVGHMGKSLSQGLLNSGFNKQNIILSNNKENNNRAVQKADLIILAVKPFQVKEVMLEIKDVIHYKLLISVAAAVSISTIQKFTDNKKQKIIRIMPNLPVAYNQGIVGFYANKAVSQSEKVEVKNLLSRLGTVLELNSEEKIDNLTLISACGPGLVSYLITMFSNAAISFGLSKKSSDLLAIKTFTGTLNYLELTGLKPQQLQRAVATKGGVTEEIILSMETNKISSYFHESLKKGKMKIDKLRKEVNFNGNN